MYLKTKTCIYSLTNTTSIELIDIIQNDTDNNDNTIDLPDYITDHEVKLYINFKNNNDINIDIAISLLSLSSFMMDNSVIEYIIKTITLHNDDLTERFNHFAKNQNQRIITDILNTNPYLKLRFTGVIDYKYMDMLCYDHIISYKNITIDKMFTNVVKYDNKFMVRYILNNYDYTKHEINFNHNIICHSFDTFIIILSSFTLTLIQRNKLMDMFDDFIVKRFVHFQEDQQKLLDEFEQVLTVIRGLNIITVEPLMKRIYDKMISYRRRDKRFIMLKFKNSPDTLEKMLLMMVLNYNKYYINEVTYSHRCNKSMIYEIVRDIIHYNSKEVNCYNILKYILDDIDFNSMFGREIILLIFDTCCNYHNSDVFKFVYNNYKDIVLRFRNGNMGSWHNELIDEWESCLI